MESQTFLCTRITITCGLALYYTAYYTPLDKFRGHVYAMLAYRPHFNGVLSASGIRRLIQFGRTELCPESDRSGIRGT